ncbi:unnamed protein product [Protopolystoma xenopodis]|uniref:OB domain-containing protein n=1 Tax=Protopolystoma xenopodis TaxID=117903 RepID=A0A448WDV4_9PLAT|nr:unnamed protein product [Protopolystoma xenopodis]
MNSLMSRYSTPILFTSCGSFARKNNFFHPSRVASSRKRLPESREIRQVRDIIEADFVTLGWVRGIRKHKSKVFLDISDGSSSKKLQVVCSPDLVPKGISIGSAISATGCLVACASRASKASSHINETISEELTHSTRLYELVASRLCVFEEAHLQADLSISDSLEVDIRLDDKSTHKTASLSTFPGPLAAAPSSSTSPSQSASALSSISSSLPPLDIRKWGAQIVTSGLTDTSILPGLGLLRSHQALPFRHRLDPFAAMLRLRARTKDCVHQVMRRRGYLEVYNRVNCASQTSFF